jgi:galactokinase
MEISNSRDESTSLNAAREIKNRLSAQFAGPVRVFRAPGRVNLIGEHTDYNDGFVMPAAIRFYIWVAISPRDDRKLVLQSEDFPDQRVIDLADVETQRSGEWTDYVSGVALTLEQAGHRLRGANLLIRGDVPVGAGLSSSAAIGVASGMALLENSEISLPAVELAKICQRSENEFVGARVGIMDPFVSRCGQEGKALTLDCRSLAFELLPIPETVSLVICNTMVKHALANGEYNTRRRECEEGVRVLEAVLPEIHSLRDVTLEQLETHRTLLSTLLYRRCRHVISENGRVLAAAAALKKRDLSAFGKLMAKSHESLRDDFEVSCRELDMMVEIASSCNGIHGARMTGGGFGGCTINIVANESVDEFEEEVRRVYRDKMGLEMQILVSNAAEGATEVRI